MLCEITAAMKRRAEKSDPGGTATLPGTPGGAEGHCIAQACNGDPRGRCVENLQAVAVHSTVFGSVMKRRTR